MYLYADNNPVNFVDHDGKFPFPVIFLAIRLGIGAYNAYTTYKSIRNDPSASNILLSLVPGGKIGKSASKKLLSVASKAMKKSKGKSTFNLPSTVKANKGVTGNFSIKGYSYRVDTNKTAPGEGGFHIHIYRNGKEVAKVSGTGSWARNHSGNTLLKPSEIDKAIRTDINRLIRHVQKRL